MTDAETAQPFDPAAPGYDEAFTASVTGRLQRDRVWQVLERVLPPSGRFLDLGCGTGEDALWLVLRGAALVVGCDVSAAMLAVARRKADDSGVGERVSLRRIDLARIARESAPAEAPFDGAVANFGVLNCLEDRRPLAAAVSSWLAPGAPLVIVMMGRHCAWELVWHLIRLEPSAAFRRWRQGREAPLPGGGRVRVWYPTVQSVRRELDPAFEHVETVGIGAFVPPPYLDHLVIHRPRLLRLLNRLEARLGDRAPWTSLADHVLLVFRNRRSN